LYNHNQTILSGETMPVTIPNQFSWLQHLPKVELHLHLEGAIPLAALWELVQKYGGDPAVPSLDSLQDKFQYQDFPHFIETWVWKNRFLRQYEDFTFIAEAVARDLARQNIRYVEAFYSPPDFYRSSLQTQPLTEAIRAGLGRVPEVEVNLIADLVRNYGPLQGARTLAEVNEVKSLGVIGIGIGGSEQDFPPDPYNDLFENARRLGFHTTAHAGEAAGPASVWGAIRSLHVERIGHATRSVEDPALVAYLAEKQIPLELCPLSNCRTGVVPSIKAHPVRQFFDQGLLITINSDDPKMFNNSLAEEYDLLINEHGFTPPEIKTLVLNAVQSSWLPPDRKQALQSTFQSSPAWEVL
jgi:adenosine deaminase